MAANPERGFNKLAREAGAEGTSMKTGRAEELLTRASSPPERPPTTPASRAGEGGDDLRHTYATFSIAAGVSLFALARRTGTSLQMIDQTYGHLAPDADDYELGLLDAYDARGSSTGGHILDTAN